MALGAILAWAVTFETEGIDINMVGVILFAVGILGIVVTLVASSISQRTVIERNREVVMPVETVQQQQFQQQVPQPDPVGHR